MRVGEVWHGARWATATASRPRSACCGSPLHRLGCCWLCRGCVGGFEPCEWGEWWRGARPAAAIFSPPQRSCDGRRRVAGGARCGARGDCGWSRVRWMASRVRWAACQARRSGAARGARRQRRVRSLRQTVGGHRVALVVVGTQWWGWHPKQCQRGGRPPLGPLGAAAVVHSLPLRSAVEADAALKTAPAPCC